MSTQLKEKYGLFTAIAMVVGIVIGSGVFFKAEKILTATGGNLPIGILAWGIGGFIMIACAYVFSIMATRYSYVNGIVDYAEASCGKKYAYLVGWFMTMIYYPSLTSVLSWLCARYICVILGWDITGGACMLMAMLFLIMSYVLNVLSPVIAGKFQVATALVKLVPLLLMAIVGTIVGLANGLMIENFTTVVTKVGTGNALFTALVATAFAYEGWIIATSINAELKNAKRNLPIALCVGSLIVVAVYILYFIGLAGGVSSAVMMESGEKGARIAFEAVFSRVGATFLFVFIVISCMGTLNGLMLACVRGMYSIAVRGEGPAPHIFKQIDPTTNMPTNSGIVGLLLSALWLFFFYGSQLGGGWFGPFSFDSSELPIVTIYAAYIPIFLWIMRRGKDLSGFNRFVAPALAICGCIFMMLAACFAHGVNVVYYLIVFAAVMGISLFWIKPKELPRKE